MDYRLDSDTFYNNYTVACEKYNVDTLSKEEFFRVMTSNFYRVISTLAQGKACILEFYVHGLGGLLIPYESGKVQIYFGSPSNIKTLAEKTVKELTEDSAEENNLFDPIKDFK